MMIFGVAYHVIPRFVGHPLHNRRLAGAHWWVANIALAILSAGFVLVPMIGARAFPVQAVGGTWSRPRCAQNSSSASACASAPLGGAR